MLLTAKLWALNRCGGKPITKEGGPVVSLTSFGTRIKTVYLAVESIGRGRVLPSRIILWLDDRSICSSPPPTIKRLMKRGLELQHCENFGPHKKYYPYLLSQNRFDTPLVTADDDILYPSYWLERLVDAFRSFPNVVNCHWAHALYVSKDGIGKYWEGRQCSSTRPDFRHQAHSGAGIIFPPAFLNKLKSAGTFFEDFCPNADDVWLHAQALRAGFRTRQMSSRRFEPLWIPGTQCNGLYKENQAGGDDQQMKDTYTADDIKVMMLELGSSTLA